MTGTLYGLGVGPGAPDLLTLRAVNVLRTVDVILAAASPRNDYSAALDTARPHLRADARLLRLDTAHYSILSVYKGDRVIERWNC